MDLQFLFQFVENIKGIAPFAVHLVDENNHRGVAHATHLHEPSRLRLHAFGRVYHDDDRVHGRQCAVGVFGKVLVSGGVEDVHLVGFPLVPVGQVVEFHDRCCYGDAALLLDVHPVGCRRFADFVVFHGPGHLNLATEEQEFLGQCGFTGVGV
jgi:hypothetical protein